MESLTLAAVAAQPESVTQTITLPHGDSILYRPLLPTDTDGLALFLASLSPRTRRFWNLDSYDRVAAGEMCAAIARYDKLRLVAVGAEPDATILALFEFAFSLGSDRERFHGYGIPIDENDTCRFGPCVRDEYQRRGLGSALMPPTLEIARRFGKRRVILWGGVFQENAPAVAFYRKHGFHPAGAFRDDQACDGYDMYIDLA